MTETKTKKPNTYDTVRRIASKMAEHARDCVDHWTAARALKSPTSALSGMDKAFAAELEREICYELLGCQNLTQMRQTFDALRDRIMTGGFENNCSCGFAREAGRIQMRAARNVYRTFRWLLG